MAISGLKTWVDDEVMTAAALNADKAILEAKFGAITNADISATAAIENDRLANKHYELALNLAVNGLTWNTAADGDVVALAGIGNDVDTTQYDIVSVEYGAWGGAGGIAVNDTFDLEWGYFDAGGVWTLITQINTGGVVAVPTLAAQRGSWANLAAVAAHIHLGTAATTRGVFAIQARGVAGGFGVADELLQVCIKLKRTDGLRS